MIIPCYYIGLSRVPGAGRGLFVDQAVARGRILIAPAEVRRQQLLPCNELGRLSEEQQAATVRWFEDRCALDTEWSDECYLNHSFSPNALWHLGFVFAFDDLAPSTEVTIDDRCCLTRARPQVPTTRSRVYQSPDSAGRKACSDQRSSYRRYSA